MKNLNRNLGIAAAAVFVLGLLIEGSTLFAAYTWTGTDNLSPSAMSAHCTSPAGHLAQMVYQNAASACSAATSINTFGDIVVFLGVVLGVVVGVRVLLARRATQT